MFDGFCLVLKLLAIILYTNPNQFLTFSRHHSKSKCCHDISLRHDTNRSFIGLFEIFSGRSKYSFSIPEPFRINSLSIHVILLRCTKSNWDWAKDFTFAKTTFTLSQNYPKLNPKFFQDYNQERMRISKHLSHLSQFIISNISESIYSVSHIHPRFFLDINNAAKRRYNSKPYFILETALNHYFV